MQLHYNILWLDNDIGDYLDRGALEKIERFLIDLGFYPKIVPLADESQLHDQLARDKFDLLLSDYELNHSTGDQVINKIRENGFDNEILFYSTKSNFKERVSDSLKFVDRISYHQGRDTLLDRIEKLIKLTLGRLLELNATRGLITSVTSELDSYMEVIAHKVMESANPKALVEIFKKNHDEIGKKKNKDISELENYLKNSNLKTYYSNTEAYRKWILLKKLINSGPPYKGFDLELLSKYNDEVIQIRNKFAHCKSENIGDKIVLKGRVENKDFAYDDDACIKIRKNLINHRNNFNILLAHFGIAS